jgi:uncharacterized membrane protein
MDILLEYLFLYCFCASGGWCIEVVYRGFRHRKVVNPGFLTGCCLPLYGVGGCVLYFLSGLRFRGLPSEAIRVAIILLLASAVMTLIELIGGLIAVKIFHVRLWDYSGEWMNFQGLICPKFTVFWGLICAVYYFLAYPLLRTVASGVIDLPWLILAVGMYVGVFVVDLAHSMRLMQRVRAYALRMRTLIHLDQLKSSAREYYDKENGMRNGKRAPFNFYRMVNRYVYDMQSYREQIHRKWGGKDETDTRR